ERQVPVAQLVVLLQLVFEILPVEVFGRRDVDGARLAHDRGGAEVFAFARRALALSARRRFVLRVARVLRGWRVAVEGDAVKRRAIDSSAVGGEHCVTREG